MRQREPRTSFGGNMRLLSFGLLGLALAIAPSHHAVAQDWPNRPVTMVVPFPAGAAVDTLARAVAHALSEDFGKQFIVENRAGAGGNLGGTAVAKAAADGHTWLFGTPAPIALNKFMYKGLAYDSGTGFHAGRAGRQVAHDHYGDTGLSGEDASRADCLCQTEPGQGQCRPSRQRNARTHHLVADPAVRRRGDDACALSRLGAADHGPAGGDKSTSPWISCRPICNWWPTARSARSL